MPILNGANVACIYWVKLQGFEMEFAIGCSAEIPWQFKHKGDPAICTKLDSSENYPLERLFGGHDEINELQPCMAERRFLTETQWTNVRRFGSDTGIRTRICALRGRCPNP
jgi:hypothetical protein